MRKASIAKVKCYITIIPTVKFSPLRMFCCGYKVCYIHNIYLGNFLMDSYVNEMANALK